MWLDMYGGLLHMWLDMYSMYTYHIYLNANFPNAYGWDGRCYLFLFKFNFLILFTNKVIDLSVW